MTYITHYLHSIFSLLKKINGHSNEYGLKKKKLDHHRFLILSSFFFGIKLLLTCCPIFAQNLWGVTTFGGSTGKGVIFSYNATTGTYTKKIVLSVLEGANPYGSLMQANDGNLYGLTALGGANNSGTLFAYDMFTNTYTKKIDLNTVNGIDPQGSMIQASNGKLYGMTNNGGINNVGVLFEYDISTNTYTKKIDLSIADGAYTYGSLIQALNGKLYGLTIQGGANNEGVLFEYDISSNTYTKRIDLSNTDGKYPYGSLIQAGNGKLYGLTQAGGTDNGGVLFEYDILTNTYTKKVDFTNANGSSPFGSLIQASNGKLYGLTYVGGANNDGVLFEYDISTNIFTKKIDCNSIEGELPYGSLMQASNGKLYGLMNNGGANNVGVLFEYDFLTNTYTKKIDLRETEDGAYPYFTNLIEVAPDSLSWNISVSLNKQWNLVSVPVTVGDYHSTVLFRTATSNPFLFNICSGGGYSSAPSGEIENGKGYWIKFPSSQTVGFTGSDITNHEITVCPGWNLIGSISSPVPVASITSNPPGMQTSEFYGYNHGYSTSATIEPGKGYWVNANQAGTLTLTSTVAKASTGKIHIVSTSELPPPPPNAEVNTDYSTIPSEFALSQNYPNPFNPTTTISYQIPEVGTRLAVSVNLKIYNMLGEEVTTLVNELQDAGYKSVIWDASKMPSGVYTYRLIAGEYTATKKLLLMK